MAESGSFRWAATACLLLLRCSVAESTLPDRARTRAAVPALVHADAPIGGARYRTFYSSDAVDQIGRRGRAEEYVRTQLRAKNTGKDGVSRRKTGGVPYDPSLRSSPSSLRRSGRSLANQLSGCCYTYQDYSAASMCSLYGQDCESGETPSHDSTDGDCSQAGLSFIGVSFSVYTSSGNPYSYQLCDQFTMENIIDRDYDYVMSMDEDGWLVGGGYNTFDYSGKIPYVDSSHTELLRIGSLDPDYGGTSIEQVYQAMNNIDIPPLKIFPEYIKGGGGGGGGGDNDNVPTEDVTMIVSIVEEYGDDDSASIYEQFLYDLFSAMDDVGGGSCMDDQDTDPHVSMGRGIKFKSSYHEENYFFDVNLEVAVWQAMYPDGVVIGTTKSSSFPLNSGSKQNVGYGSLFFFFDRANITQAFTAERDLSDSESYYSTLMSGGGDDSFRNSVTDVEFDYEGGGGDDDGAGYEHNPYNWKADMAMHDPTGGWDLPPNCKQEGEAFFGIPLSRRSNSKLQTSGTFQEQFDFENVIDRNFTYMQKFGTNHGWMVGESIGNGAGFIVDKDTAHIPLFYLGTTNTDMGGMSLKNMIRIAGIIDFGVLYIKPAFVYIDSYGHVKLQFEADANSALGYLYNALASLIGITWNYNSPSNTLGVYTNCAMHSAGDRAHYGCGPDNSNTGGFCPQMTLAYSVSFQSEDLAAAYLEKCNDYVDYWRSLYPSGVAVGTNKFCKGGGCMGLFLNRMDLYEVFEPNLGGSWVEFGDSSMAPTVSPAPTYIGGCDDPHNQHLDRCMMDKRANIMMIWDAVGAVGQFSILLVTVMGSTLTIFIFLARTKRKRRKGESVIEYFFRSMRRRKKKSRQTRRKKRRKRSSSRGLDKDLVEKKSGRDRYDRSDGSKHTSGSRRSKSRSKSRPKSRSKSRRGRNEYDGWYA